MGQAGFPNSSEPLSLQFWHPRFDIVIADVVNEELTLCLFPFLAEFRRAASGLTDDEARANPSVPEALAAFESLAHILVSDCVHMSYEAPDTPDPLVAFLKEKPAFVALATEYTAKMAEVCMHSKLLLLLLLLLLLSLLLLLVVVRDKFISL